MSHRAVTLLTYILLCALAVAADRLPRRLYEVTTATEMPHLEENLRYAITTERRCLAHEDLATAFPILTHPALADCSLEPSPRDSSLYELRCTGKQGTTGKAEWELTARRVRGTLTVKLGGKNMTFYQRVTAMPLGECPPATP